MTKLMMLLALLGFCFTTQLFAQETAEAEAIVGLWEPSNGKARVKIEKIGDKYFGRIVYLKEPNDPATGTPKTDKNNPDESLRSVPLKGYRMLKDFEYDKNKEWINGTIYDPENGSTYSCVIKMKDPNTLEIRGYIGVKTFGRTDVWSKIEIKKK